jgi:Leucine-rich repeat (LRR) protein
LTKTELKQSITKIKKFLKKRDYDAIDTGIELARGLDEPAVFEALLGGWSINQEGKLVLEEGYQGETLTKRWSDESWPYFAYALVNLIGYRPNDKETKNNIHLLNFSGSWSSSINRFPIGICKFLKLKKLYLPYNKIANLPEEIGELSELEILDISNNNISDDGIPNSLNQLINLKELSFSENHIQKFPKTIGSLICLEKLQLRGKYDFQTFDSVIDDIGNLVKLEVLDLSDNNITTLPKSIGRLSKLKNLDLSGNNLESLPESIAGLKSLDKLNLYMNNLNTLPRGIFNLDATIMLWSNFRDRKKTDQWLETLDKPVYFEKLLSNYIINGAGKIKANYVGAEYEGSYLNFESSKALANEKGFIFDEGFDFFWNLFANSAPTCQLDTSFRKDKIFSIQLESIPSRISEFKNIKNISIVFFPDTEQTVERLELVGELETLETLNISGFPLKVLPGEFVKLKNLIELDISNSISLEDINIIINLPKLKKLNMEGCDSLYIRPHPANMVFEKDIKKYKIKLLKAAGEPIPKYLQQKNKASKEIKSYIPKLKKFLKQRDYDAIDTGIELARSLGEPSLFETLLEDCSIDDSGQLVRNKLFTGTQPAQPFLDYALWNLIGYSLSESQSCGSMQLNNIKKVSFDYWKRGYSDYGATRLNRFPKGICNLTKLEELDLHFAELTALPDEIDQLKNLRKLDLSAGSNVASYSSEIGDWYLPWNKFSDEEKNKIKKLLPNTEIIF